MQHDGGVSGANDTHGAGLRRGTRPRVIELGTRHRRFQAVWLPGTSTRPSGRRTEANFNLAASSRHVAGCGPLPGMRVKDLGGCRDIPPSFNQLPHTGIAVPLDLFDFARS